MKNVLFAMSKAAVDQYTSSTMSAEIVASVALGKLGGRLDYLSVEIVNPDAFRRKPPPLIKETQALQEHIREMLSIGAMKLRPSPQFRAFASTIEMWGEGGSISVTKDAKSTPPSEGAERLGSLAESEYLCSVCLKAGFEVSFLETPPKHLNDVIGLFHSLNFKSG